MVIISKDGDWVLCDDIALAQAPVGAHREFAVGCGQLEAWLSPEIPEY
jgi:hypothetical protein